jgi:hypothetical protein
MEIKQVQTLLPYDKTVAVLGRRRSSIFSSVTKVGFCLRASQEIVRPEEIKDILKIADIKL